MNYILKEYLYKFVLVYLDNILIFSKTFNKYVKYIQMVLAKLQEFNLQTKPKKYKFYVKKVIFLGYVILETYIKIDLAKVKAVLD